MGWPSMYDRIGHGSGRRAEESRVREGGLFEQAQLSGGTIKAQSLDARPCCRNLTIHRHCGVSCGLSSSNTPGTRRRLISET